MTKYHHELPKDPTLGYPLAALAPFDAAAHRPGGKTYERLHPQSCQCTTPRFDRLTRGGLTFDEFCCACRLPSEASLSAEIDQCFSARNLYLTGPAGYGFQTSEQGVTIYPPKGDPFPHRPGEQILDGHHHACWHAEMLWHTAYPFSVLPEQPIRATPDEIRQTMRRIFDEHEILKGRCDFAVLPSEDSPYTRQVTILLDDVPLTAKRIADRTFAEIERDARVEAEATVALLKKSMAPEACPACDGHLSLCQECGGKGWLPHYKAARLRIEKRVAETEAYLGRSSAPCKHGHYDFCGLCRSENAPKCEHGHAHYCVHCGNVE